MKSLVLTMSLLTASVAMADQSATMTCTGKKVVLAVKSLYLGENAKSKQELYVLKLMDNDNETKNTAYFLNIEQDIGGARNCFGAGSLIFSGSNEAKGDFELCIQAWEEKGDGTVVRQTSSGVISYKHGPLKGKDEPVSCVLE